MAKKQNPKELKTYFVSTDLLGDTMKPKHYLYTHLHETRHIHVEWPVTPKLNDRLAHYVALKTRGASRIAIYPAEHTVDDSAVRVEYVLRDGANCTLNVHTNTSSTALMRKMKSVLAKRGKKLSELRSSLTHSYHWEAT